MIFPYLSLYLLVFSFICFILFIIVPFPHGKFSWKSPLMIDSDIAWALMQGSTLTVLFGYLDVDNNTWVFTLPKTNKGLVALVFFIIHVIWRSFISVLWIRKIHKELQETRGNKKTSFLLVLASWLYYPVVGMLIRYMCVHITENISAHDIIFLLGAFVFLGLNAYTDITLNKSRCISPDVKTHASIGTYLTKDGIRKHFKVLVHLGIDCPNYFFEILEWGFYALLTRKFESLWWFLSSLMILLPRALWTSQWLSQDDPEELEVTIHERQPPRQAPRQPPSQPPSQAPRQAPRQVQKIHTKTKKMNGLVF